MFIHFPITPLLASDEIARAMGSQFRGEAARIDLSEIATAVAAVALAALILWSAPMLVRLSRRTRRLNCPKRLFEDLCREHGLKSSDRKLLLKAAQQLKLDPPALLFLNVELPASSQVAPATAALLRRVLAGDGS